MYIYKHDFKNLSNGEIIIMSFTLFLESSLDFFSGHISHYCEILEFLFHKFNGDLKSCQIFK
jgi:hypothetical protein